ncbi:hypothetical protein V8C86DRAFT_675638 [Haematococcus lacustris]
MSMVRGHPPGDPDIELTSLTPMPHRGPSMHRAHTHIHCCCPSPPAPRPTPPVDRTLHWRLALNPQEPMCLPHHLAQGAKAYGSRPSLAAPLSLPPSLPSSFPPFSSTGTTLLLTHNLSFDQSMNPDHPCHSPFPLHQRSLQPGTDPYQGPGRKSSVATRTTVPCGARTPSPGLACPALAWLDGHLHICTAHCLHVPVALAVLQSSGASNQGQLAPSATHQQARPHPPPSHALPR